ncbi:hypothetical protein B0H10DRAFT_1957253 [Mycena sp. CBHHK59/15]|nr:hypothetical protein B0H10DRAFT_1957253 [Mycena sp. CBHHK59/15]
MHVHGETGTGTRFDSGIDSGKMGLTGAIWCDGVGRANSMANRSRGNEMEITTRHVGEANQQESASTGGCGKVVCFEFEFKFGSVWQGARESISPRAKLLLARQPGSNSIRELTLCLDRRAVRFTPVHTAKWQVKLRFPWFIYFKGKHRGKTCGNWPRPRLHAQSQWMAEKPAHNTCLHRVLASETDEPAAAASAAFDISMKKLVDRYTAPRFRVSTGNAKALSETFVSLVAMLDPAMLAEVASPSGELWVGV